MITPRRYPLRIRVDHDVECADEGGDDVRRRFPGSGLRVRPEGILDVGGRTEGFREFPGVSVRSLPPAAEMSSHTAVMPRRTEPVVMPERVERAEQRIRTFARWISPAASSPWTCGMVQSMITVGGRSSVAQTIASRPSAAAAQISQSGLWPWMTVARTAWIVG